MLAAHFAVVDCHSVSCFMECIALPSWCSSPDYFCCFRNCAALIGAEQSIQSQLTAAACPRSSAAGRSQLTAAAGPLHLGRSRLTAAAGPLHLGSSQLAAAAGFRSAVCGRTQQCTILCFPTGQGSLQPHSWSLGVLSFYSNSAHVMLWT